MPLPNRGNWNPALHPRDPSNGEFIYTDGGRRSKKTVVRIAGPSALRNALSKLPLDTTYEDKAKGKANPNGIYITHYGPGTDIGGWDPSNDSGTNRGVGNRENKLNSLSLAISKDTVKSANLKPGGHVYINGQFIGNYDDTPDGDGRIDIYDYNNTVGTHRGGMVCGGVVTNHP